MTEYFPEEKLKAVFLLANIELKDTKTVPNQYCGPECCPQNKWWVVETDIGVIKLGWRKRVINVDFSLVPNHPSGESLTKEEVTKGRDNIHAWSYGDLVNYLISLHSQTRRNNVTSGPIAQR